MRRNYLDTWRKPLSTDPAKSPPKATRPRTPADRPGHSGGAKAAKAGGQAAGAAKAKPGTAAGKSGGGAGRLAPGAAAAALGAAPAPPGAQGVSGVGRGSMADTRSQAAALLEAKPSLPLSASLPILRPPTLTPLLKASLAAEKAAAAPAEASRPVTSQTKSRAHHREPVEGRPSVLAAATQAAASAMADGLGLAGLAHAAKVAAQAEADEAARVGTPWRPPVIEVQLTAKPPPPIPPKLLGTLKPWEERYLRKGAAQNPDYKVILPEEEEYTPRFAFSTAPGARDEKLGPQAKLYSWIGVAGSKVGNDNFSSFPLPGDESGRILRLFHASHRRNARTPLPEPKMAQPTTLEVLSMPSLPPKPPAPMPSEKDVPKLTQSVALVAPDPQKSLMDDCVPPPAFGVISPEPIAFKVVPPKNEPTGAGDDEEGKAAPTPAAKDLEPLVLEHSPFAPRKHHSDGHAFFTTPRVRSRAFQIDWSRCNNERFRYLIAREDNEGRAGVDFEMAEIREVLAQHMHALYPLYAYYCATGSPSDAHDGFALGRQTYFDFLRHVNAIDEDSKYCTVSALTSIFIAANYEAQNVSVEQRELNRANSDGALMRFEFLQCLVRIAIAKYVRGGAIPDVSEALEAFIVKDVLPAVPSEATHDPDVFRRKRFYTKDIAALLARYEAPLRVIFEYYAAVEGDPLQLDLKTPEPSMSFEEWRGFLTDAGLLQLDKAEEGASEWSGRLSILDARLCFVWSQTFVSDELKRRHKLSTCTFVDFCEALGRICTRFPLPSPEVLAKYGSRSAKTFFDEIKAGKHDGNVMLPQRASTSFDPHESQARHQSGALTTEMVPEHEEVKDASVAPALEMLIGLILERLDSDANGKIDKKELEQRRLRRARRHHDFLTLRQVSFKPSAALTDKGAGAPSASKGAASKQQQKQQQMKQLAIQSNIEAALRDELPDVSVKPAE